MVPYYFWSLLTSLHSAWFGQICVLPWCWGEFSSLFISSCHSLKYYIVFFWTWFPQSSASLAWHAKSLEIRLLMSVVLDFYTFLCSGSATRVLRCGLRLCINCTRVCLLIPTLLFRLSFLWEADPTCLLTNPVCCKGPSFPLHTLIRGLSRAFCALLWMSTCCGCHPWAPGWQALFYIYFPSVQH